MRGFKVHIILAGLFLFVHAPAFSQVNFPLNLKLADSLEKILPTISGKEKIDALNGISFALIRHYSNRSDSIAKIAVDLARKINYKEGLAKAYFCKGTNDYINGNFIEGLDLLYDAVDLYKAMADTSMIIDTYYQIAGVSYFSLTDLEEGIRLVSECLRYSSESGDKLREAQMYSTLQYLYATAGDGDRALYYMDLYEKTASKISTPRIEKAMVTAAWGRNYALKADFKKAIPFYFSALQMVNPDDIEERSYLAQLCNFIGDAYLNLGRQDSAMVFFQKGMKLSRKHQVYYGSIINALGLARLYLKENDFLQSELYCDSVIYFGEKIDSSGSFYGIAQYNKLLGMSGEHYIPMNNEFKRFLAWRIMAGAYQILMRISEQQGEYRNALHVNIQLNRINDSIVNFQKRTEILDLLHKYQAEQKDHQISLLSQENQLQNFKINQNRLILFLVIAVSALSLLILILFIGRNRIRSERKLVELKQKLLRSQMNPHFIFNSLTSIQNFILEQQDLMASFYLSKFSDLVRSILKNTLVEEISIEEERTIVENYLELQKVRFPEKFDYHIHVDDHLDQENIFVPPMLAQPFIENAIEHGIRNLGSKGKINIRFIRSNSKLILEIEDNGIGREKAEELLRQRDKTHKSMATTITRERIAILNRKLKRKITMEIIDMKDEQGEARGTRVVFGVPV